MIGSSTQHGLNGKLQLGDYLNDRARRKIGKFRRDYAAKGEIEKFIIRASPSRIPNANRNGICTSHSNRRSQM